MNDLIQEIVKEVMEEMLADAKDDVKSTVTDVVIPAVDEAVTNYCEELIAEADASDSYWVKFRDKVIVCGVVKLVWSFTQKLVTKVLDRADEIEAAESEEETVDSVEIGTVTPVEQEGE